MCIINILLSFLLLLVISLSPTHFISYRLLFPPSPLPLLLPATSLPYLPLRPSSLLPFPSQSSHILPSSLFSSSLTPTGDIPTTDTYNNNNRDSESINSRNTPAKMSVSVGERERACVLQQFHPWLLSVLMSCPHGLTVKAFCR